MAFPSLTHLQALVLRLILGGRKNGQEIRAGLAVHGVPKSHPAFYELLGRMESAGFVDGEYAVAVEGGQTIKRREFSITADGRAALREAAAFYADDLERLRNRRAA